MKVLITGANGLLGQKIVDYCLVNNIDFVASSQGENRNSKVNSNQFYNLDIRNKTQIENIVKQERPTTIINTAAITNVDLCESEKTLCDEVNTEAVNHMLKISEDYGLHLIHLSTDFVFDGENGPYSEDDETNALSYYGKSKENSEVLLKNSNYKNWTIVRTIIVFGIGENMSRSNIVLWAKSALEKGEPLNIVNDQFRAPTDADDLAWACMKIAEKKSFGIFNISGPETFSIMELVKRVGAYFDLSTKTLSPISSESLNQAAKRPPKTGFDISKAQIKLNYSPLKFEESLEKLENQLKKN